MHQPVFQLNPLRLRGKGSEQAIEDDQDAAIIAIEIGFVAGVMHAMSRGRVENIFQRPQFRDQC